jgi:hypothetical protein
MECGVAVRQISKLLLRTADTHVSRRSVERAWQVNCALRDFLFLFDSMGTTVTLHHDLVPLDPSGTYHAGHFTAVYKGEQDRVDYHVLKIWITQSTDAKASKFAFDDMTDYFSSLCDRLIRTGHLPDDAFFDSSLFAGIVTDRGAKLKGIEITRLFEPLHRVHGWATLIVSRMNAKRWAQSVCDAANFVLHPEFEAYLVAKVPQVCGIVGFVWARPTLGGEREREKERERERERESLKHRRWGASARCSPHAGRSPASSTGRRPFSTWC